MVQLGALKAAGNPLARAGKARRPRRRRHAAGRNPRQRHRGPRRLDAGHGVRRVFGGPAGRPAAASAGQRAARLPDRHAHRPPRDAPGARRPGRPGPEAEAAQPLYARYWLHNRAPPLGGLPAVAYLHPHTVAAEPGSEVVLRLTVASDCTDTEVRGTLTLVCPHGWVAGPGQLPVTLRPANIGKPTWP
ncbi:NPCBM-associated, NEW3 domain of alpha-galactosidase family protein [Mycobacterium xenopi 3993]|nr:NPCBM-associated, NEW3 domain of alpha-galactosidase family protein [Mycobacterium xenopi 3993]